MACSETYRIEGPGPYDGMMASTAGGSISHGEVELDGIRYRVFHVPRVIVDDEMDDETFGDWSKRQRGGSLAEVRVRHRDWNVSVPVSYVVNRVKRAHDIDRQSSKVLPKRCQKCNAINGDAASRCMRCGGKLVR